MAENSNLPLTWSATENVAWKAEIPGRGWGSPVVWGNKVFVTSVLSLGEEEKVKGGLYFGGERPLPEDAHQWLVHCVDLTTGEILWSEVLATEVPKTTRHLKNTYASESPAADAERFYAFFAQKGLFAFDHDGEEVWRLEMGPLQTMNGWGTASSPIVHEGKVYIVKDTMAESFLIALDAKTGDELWRVERDEPSTWATPLIWETGQRTEIVTNGLNRILSYDLQGNELWEIKGPNGQLMIPTPFIAHDMLYITSGYINSRYRPVHVVKPGATGDISLPEGETSNEFIAWHLPTAGPYNPSPIVYGDIYYTLLDRGFFTAHDALTGKEIYGKQRLDPRAGAFSASPWAYRDHLFALSEDGDTFVIQAGPEFKVVGKNSLDGEFSMSSPAIVGDRLLIRTQYNIYCIQDQSRPPTS